MVGVTNENTISLQDNLYFSTMKLLFVASMHHFFSNIAVFLCAYLFHSSLLRFLMPFFYFQIEPKRDDDPNPASERIVTIKGIPDAIWRVGALI